MSTIKISSLPVASLPLTASSVLPIVQGGVTSQTSIQSILNLGGLAGTNYIYVTADGTDTDNATALLAAYTTAQGMSLSSTNRITIIAAPGYYDFGNTPFVMDTSYIDLVSLDGNRSIIFNSDNSAGTISITANDVFVKGVDVGTKNFTISTNLNLLKIENCKGGQYSFGGDSTEGSNPITVSGTFTNCVGGNKSFGGYGTASGTFINCIGGNDAFGVTASGIFTDCVGGDLAFGSRGGAASGTFTNCNGGGAAFAGTSGPFGSGNASGVFRNCIGGIQAFGYVNGFSGIAVNCQGGYDAFGNYFLGSLTGKLYYCRLTDGVFQTVSGAGITRLCIDGNNVENNQG